MASCVNRHFWHSKYKAKSVRHTHKPIVVQFVLRVLAVGKLLPQGHQQLRDGDSFLFVVGLVSVKDVTVLALSRGWSDNKQIWIATGFQGLLWNASVPSPPPQLCSVTTMCLKDLGCKSRGPSTSFFSLLPFLATSSCLHFFFQFTLISRHFTLFSLSETFSSPVQQSWMFHACRPKHLLAI